ncbi:MAG: DUF5996 family protein [Acidobacteriia bacterium]|nr:DUF5996 family protein [Terriglobia bacterium]
MTPHTDSWPALPLDGWRDTYRTLHMWTQVVGKIRMTLSPELNHWWHVALYVNARGLTTSPIPYGAGVFEIQFDFLEHQIEILTSEGGRKLLKLAPEPVSAFYSRLMEALRGLEIAVGINTMPQEVPETVPFDQDHRPGAYDRDAVQRFWRILLSTDIVLQEFRSGFLGKASPVHFFWGSFDLTHTRFSGRTAPPRKGVITGPAYSHEEISVGFWPGGGAVDGPAFYSYTAPKPAGLESAPVRPAAAAWNSTLGEFILMYDDVRQAASPRHALLEFFESTYAAGARLANWDRAALERP